MSRKFLRRSSARRRSAGVAAALVLAASALAIIGSPLASAKPDTQSPFEIDGMVPGTLGGDPIPDPFGSVAELGPVNSNTTKLGVINSAAPPMLEFTNPNGQVDLRNIWLETAKDDNGDTWLYFAWQRDSNKGSGVVSYEFQQAELSTDCSYDDIDFILPETQGETDLIATCNPWAGRAEGDFLIVWDQKGQTINIILRTWDGTEFDAGTTLTTLTYPDPDGGGDLLAAEAEKSGDRFYGEATINLTQTVFAGATECITFNNIIPGTITGNSDSADYKDTVLANVDPVSNCGSITVKKVDDSGNGLNGAEFTLYEDDGDGVAELGTEDLAIATETTTGGSEGIAASATFTEVLAGDYWVDETLVPDNYRLPDDSPLPVFVTVTGDEAIVLGPYVNVLQVGSILVEKTDGSVRLDGAGFTITPGDVVMTEVGTGLFCADGLLFATYTVTESTVPTGYTGDDPQQFTVDSESTCADRSPTPDLTFVNTVIPAEVQIQKWTKDASSETNPVGHSGVTFTVWADDGDGVFDPAPDGGDTDTGLFCVTAGDGSCSIFVDPPGGFHVVETVPDGYQAQTESQFLDLQLGVQPGLLEFVNDPLSEIVITFNSLAGPGVTKATNVFCTGPSADGTSQGELEDGQSATFTDLLEGTYNCTIIVDP